MAENQESTLTTSTSSEQDAINWRDLMRIESIANTLEQLECDLEVEMSRNLDRGDFALKILRDDLIDKVSNPWIQISRSRLHPYNRDVLNSLFERVEEALKKVEEKITSLGGIIPNPPSP